MRTLELGQLMLPSDANPTGNVHGGAILKLIDTVADTCAMRYCRGNTVTASLDQVDFLKPVFIGDIVMLYASVNYVGNTSMEVGVKVEAETPTTDDRRHISSTYVTVVAMDKDSLLPKFIPETTVEKRRFSEGKVRMETRKAARLKKLNKPQQLNG